MNNISPDQFAEHIASVRNRLEQRVHNKTRCVSRATAEDGVSEAILKFWNCLNQGRYQDKDLKYMENAVVGWACRVVISLQRKDPMSRCSKDEVQRNKDSLEEGYVEPMCRRKVHMDTEDFLNMLPDVERQFDEIEKKENDQSVRELVAEIFSLAPKRSGTILRACLENLDANQEDQVSAKEVASICDMTDDGVRTSISRLRCKLINKHPEIYSYYKEICL